MITQKWPDDVVLFHLRAVEQDLTALSLRLKRLVDHVGVGNNPYTYHWVIDNHQYIRKFLEYPVRSSIYHISKEMKEKST